MAVKTRAELIAQNTATFGNGKNTRGDDEKAFNLNHLDSFLNKKGDALENNGYVAVVDGSKLKQGTNGGIAFECAVGYDFQWKDGVAYYRPTGSSIVAAVSAVNQVPNTGFDSTIFYAVGSRFFNLVTNVQYICTDATPTSAAWSVVPAGSGSPGGSTTELQYNNGGAFGGITGATTNGTFVTLTTPVLGVATATSINKVAITAPATSATLTIADGKTFTASNTLTFTGTDSSSVAFGTGGTVVYTGAATSSGLTMATDRILGRSTASTGAIEEISIGSGLSLSAGVLSASGSGSGTVNSGTQYQLAYYATTGTAVSGLTTGTSGQVLALSAGLVPTWTTLSTSTTLTNIGAATASATLTNAAASVITWNWNSNTTTNSFVLGSTGLTSGSLFTLTHTTSALTGNLASFTSTGITSGNLLNLGISGSTAVSAENLLITNSSTANTSGRGLDISITGATGSGNTFGAFISNTKTGATSTNTALSLTASGGTTNYALDVAAGIVRMAASTASLPHMLFTAGAAALTATTNGMLSYATVSSNSSFYLYKDSAVTKILTTDRNPDFAVGSASGVIIADTSGTLTKSGDLTALGIYAQTNTLTAITTGSGSLIGTVVGSATLSTNFFAAGKTLEFLFAGLISTHNSGSPSVAIDIKITDGTTTVTLGTFTYDTSGLSGRVYIGNIELTCRTSGSNPTFGISGQMIVNHTAKDQETVFITPGSITATSLNTSSALTLQLTATWTNPGASSSIDTRLNYCQYIN